jgi:hypothetical protein
MSVHEVTWSSFLRVPSSVERWLEQGDVLLRRRDGEALRLSRESNDTSERTALVTAARLLGAGLAKAKTSINAEALTSALPWTKFLPERDREAFLAEFLETIEACADLGDFAALGRLVTEWKSTAAVHAQGLAGKLTEPIGEVGEKARRPRLVAKRGEHVAPPGHPKATE